MATPKQVSFIKKLAKSKDLSQMPDYLSQSLDALLHDKEELVPIHKATEIINALLALPTKAMSKKFAWMGQDLLPGMKKPREKVKRTNWNDPLPQETIKRVASGEISTYDAAQALGVKPYIIEYRVKWLRQYGTSVTPQQYLKKVKTTSGIEVLVPPEYGNMTQLAIDWAGFFGIEQLERFDLKIICSMFYAAERFVSAKKTAPELYEIKQAAQRYIGTWTERFAKYTLAACLGEFRHRKKAGELFLVPRDSSHQARAGCQKAAEFLWTKGEESVRKATAYMVEKFKDPLFFRGAYGGPKWSKIAATLLAYMDKKIPPVVFSDYIWDLSHNGGRFFDKCPLFLHENEVRAMLDKKKASKTLDITGWAGAYLLPKWKEGLDFLEAVNWEGAD